MSFMRGDESFIPDAGFTYVNPYAYDQEMVEQMGRNGIASFLRALGWIGVVLSVLGAVAIAAESDPYESLVGLAIAVGAVGVVQSLVLIGFASMIEYMKACAIGTRMVSAQAKRTADLLSENLEEVRDGQPPDHGERGPLAD